MSQYPIQKFIELVKFDQEILAKEKDVEKIRHAIEVAKKELGACQVSLDNSKLHRQQLRKEVDAKELEMKELDTKEREAKVRLDAAKSGREYDSFKSEFDGLHLKQKDLEEQLLLAWKKFEAGELELEQKKRFCDEQMKAKNSIIEDKMKEETAVLQTIEELRKIRHTKEQGIPADWLEKYASMRTKVDNPVVPITGESCSACFYKVSQRDIIELRKSKLLLCRDCFRFLFDPTALERAAEKVDEP